MLLIFEKRHQGYDDTFFMDEVLIKIGGKQLHLCGTVAQYCEVADVFLQSRQPNLTQFILFCRISNHCDVESSSKE